MSGNGVPLVEQIVCDVEEKGEEGALADWTLGFALIEQRCSAIGVGEESGVDVDDLDTFGHGWVSVYEGGSETVSSMNRTLRRTSI